MDIPENGMSAVNREAKRGLYSAEGYQERVGSKYDLHDRRRGITITFSLFVFVF